MPFYCLRLSQIKIEVDLHACMSAACMCADYDQLFLSFAKLDFLSHSARDLLRSLLVVDPHRRFTLQQVCEGGSPLVCLYACACV